MRNISNVLKNKRGVTPPTSQHTVEPDLVYPNPQKT